MRTYLAMLTLVWTFVPAVSVADVLKCKIDGYREDVFITTSPDTNSDDGQFGRVGISPGLGNKAIVFHDRMGATVFVELNGGGTPIGLITVAANMRVVESFFPHQPSLASRATARQCPWRETSEGCCAVARRA
ncbi:hypothetical protein ACVWZZ_000589 [Bradyrhizobium sp. LM6.10]